MAMQNDNLRIMHALRIDGFKTTNLVLRKIAPLRRTIIQHLTRDGEIPQEWEVAIFDLDSTTTPLQQKISTEWLNDPDTSLGLIRKLLRLSGEYHDEAGKRILDELNSDPAKPLDSACEVMEWCPVHREEAVKILDERISAEAMKTPGDAIHHLAKMLMWSADPVRRQSAAAKYIPHFAALRKMGGVMRSKLGFNGLLWAQLWTGDITPFITTPLRQKLLPPANPSDDEVCDAITHVYD